MKATLSFIRLMMVVMAGFPYLQVEAGTYCDDSIFLRAGSRGVVSCDFGDFDVVGWLYPTNNLEKAAPFISLDDTGIHQPESDNQEYSILSTGSLVVKNVTVNHEKNYTARVYKNQEVFHEEVSVKVYVLPDSEHPVVNGRNDQDRVVVRSSNGEASFNCAMDRVRPAVPLELVFISNMSSSINKKTIQSTLNNSDGTHNVSLAVELKIGITQPIGIYSIQCKVAGNFAQFFPSVVTVDIVHDGRYKFPSVNGLDSQQHVVLDVDREGVLNCSMDRVPPDLILIWDVTHDDSSAEIVLEEHKPHSSDNGDGTFNVILISRYKTTSASVQRLNLKCKGANRYPLYTTVELNFPAADSDSFSCNTSLFKQPLERLLIFVLSTLLVLFIASSIYLTLKIRRMSNNDPAPQVPLQEREAMLQQTTNGNTHTVNSTL